MAFPLAILAPLIAQAVPAIAGIFTDDDDIKPGSAADTAIKMATGAVKSLTGSDDLATAVDKINSDPGLFASFKAEMNRNAEAILAIHARDRQDARNMMIKLAEAGHWAAGGPVIISLVVAIGFFAMLWIVLKVAVPDASKELAYVLLGGLGTSFTQVINYWCGSSKSSADKTRMLAPLNKG